MNVRKQRIPMSEQAKQALADIGGEPLAGSGFEDEMAEEGWAIPRKARPTNHNSEQEWAE
jgi:hypothetical protein